MTALTNFYLPKVMRHLGRRMTRDEKKIAAAMYILWGSHPKEVARKIREMESKP